MIVAKVSCAYNEISMVKFWKSLNFLSTAMFPMRLIFFCLLDIVYIPEVDGVVDDDNDKEGLIPVLIDMAVLISE